MLATPGGGIAAWTNYIEANIGTAENNWRGNNYPGYRNPLIERLVQDWNANAFDETKRLGIQADMLKLVYDDAVVMPLYYNSQPMAWSKRLHGPGTFEQGPAVSWNVHEWTLL